MLVSFLDWKYIRLHCSVKKRTRSNWQWNVLVCLSHDEYTVTDHGSILAVNKFYACTNLVKFIFKSFVSCNLQFQAFYVRNSMVYRSTVYIQGILKPPVQDKYVFTSGQETFCPSLPDGQGPRQAIRRLNFWQRFWEEKVSSTLKGNQVFRRSIWRKLQFIALFCWLRDALSRLRSGCLAGKVQNMDPWSMDRVHQNMNRVHGPLSWTGSMDPLFLLPLKLLK